MEYKEHSPVSHDVQTQLINAYKGNKAADEWSGLVEARSYIFLKWFI
jgi:hypothetical protein